MQPSAEQVTAQLDRILASDGFANADRMSGFLRYVVERTLAGEADQIKEYVIGVEVFGRDAAFDPRLDSIVRVEARRLRTKVDEYYAGPGAADPVLIQLRRGSYVPAFDARSAAPPADASDVPPVTSVQAMARSGRWRLGLGLALVVLVLATAAARRGGLWATNTTPAPQLSVAVLPFSEYSSDPEDKLLAARLTDGVTAELARIGTLGVASHTSVLKFTEPPRKSAREIAQALDADLLLEGTVNRSGGRVEVGVRLVDPATQRKIWVEEFAGETRDLEALERRIAAASIPAALAYTSAR